MEDTQTLEPEVADQQQPEQQDPPTKVSVKEFAAKVKAKYPEYANVDDTELTNKIIAKHPEYKDQVDFGTELKKKSNGIVLPPSGSVTPSNSEAPSQSDALIPIVDIHKGEPVDNSIEGNMPGNENDIVANSIYANQLAGRKKTIQTSDGSSFGMGTNSTQEVGDDEAIKASNDLKSKIKAAGYDPDKIAKDFEGIPDDVINNPTQPGLSKQQLLTDYKENPPLYEKKIAAAKVGSALRSALSPEDYKQVITANQNTFAGTFDQQRANVQGLVNLAQTKGGDKADDITKNIGTQYADVYAKAASDPAQLMTDPLMMSGQLNANQTAAYRWMQDTDPQTARKYDAALIPDSQIKGDTEAQLGKQEAAKRLDEAGIALQRNYANEQTAPLYKEYKALLDKPDKTPEDEKRINDIIEKGKPFNAILDNVSVDEGNLNANYPKAAKLDALDFLQEIRGQNHTGLDWLATKTGVATDNMFQGVASLLKSDFETDSQHRINRSELLANDELNNNSAYLKQGNQTTQTFKPTISDELKSDIDQIYSDKSLTEQQKKSQAIDLMINRPKEWSRTPIDGGRTNLSLSSLMYGAGGIAADLAPFIATEALTGGGATPSALKKFTSTFTAAFATGFHDSYLQALKDGDPNPYAKAMRVTAINSAALGGADAPGAIRKMFSGNPEVSKLLSKMSDDEIAATLKQSPKAISTFGKAVNAVKKVGGNVADAALEGFKGAAKVTGFQTAGQMANDAISGDMKPLADYGKEALLTTLKFGIFGTALGTIGKVAEKPSDIGLAALSKFGQNPESGLSALADMEKKGSISSEDADKIRGNIEQAARVFKGSPILNNPDISDNVKREYLYNKMVENKANDAAKNLPPTQAAKAEATGLVAKYKNDYLVTPKTDKQLDTRQAQLEKMLIPETDADGKAKDIPEKVKTETVAELEAIKQIKDERTSVNKNVTDNRKADNDEIDQQISELDKNNPLYQVKKDILEEKRKQINDYYDNYPGTTRKTNTGIQTNEGAPEEKGTKGQVSGSTDAVSGDAATGTATVLESQFPKTDKPFEQLNSDELYAHADNVKEYDKNLEENIFGAEGAKKYKEAQDISNSNSASPEDVKAADKTISEMESKLTSSQKADLFGHNLDDNGIYDHKEIRDVARKVSHIEDAENVDEISAALKNPLLSFSGNPNDVANKAIFNAAVKRAGELGVDAETLIKKSINNIIDDLSEKEYNDREFLAKSILKSIMKPNEAKEISSPKTTDNGKGNKAETQTGDENVLNAPNEEPTTASDNKGAVVTKENFVSQSGVDKASAKKVYNEMRQLDEPSDARGLALAYLAHGGKFTKEALADLLPGKGEKESRDYIHSKGAKSIERAAEDIWHGLPEELQPKVDVQDIRNELENAVSDHKTKLEAAKEFVKSYGVEEPIYAPTEAEVSTEEERLLKYLNDESERNYEHETISDNEVLNIINHDSENETDNQQPSTGTESKSDKGDSPKSSTEKEKINESKTTEIPKSSKESSTTTEGTKTDSGNAEPPKKETDGDGEEQSKGTRINKKGILDQYDKKIDFAPIKDKAAVNKVADDIARSAEANGVTPEAEAEKQVAIMADKEKEAVKASSEGKQILPGMRGTLDPSEHNIVTATYHLMNLDEKIDKALTNVEKATDEDEKTYHAQQVEDLSKERDKTLAVLRVMGNKSGRNLSLFAGVFSKLDGGGIGIEKMRIQRALGIPDLPMTLEGLEKSDLTKEQKDIARPYVKQIEESEAKIKEAERKAKVTVADLEDEQVKKAIEEAYQRGRKDAGGKDEVITRKGDKSLADKIRQLKTDKNNINLDLRQALTLGNWNHIIEGIAKLVEAGVTIKDAISKMIENGDMAEVDRKQVEDKMMQRISGIEQKESAIEKIKDIAENEQATTITKSMVSSGLIKTVVNDYIKSDVSAKDVIKSATEELKKTLPDVTEKEVGDAFVKRGDFAEETKQKLQTELSKKTQEVKKTVIKSRGEESADDAKKEVIKNVSDTIDNYSNKLTGKISDAIAKGDTEKSKALTEVKDELGRQYPILKDDKKSPADIINAVHENLDNLERKTKDKELKAEIGKIKNDLISDNQKTFDQISKERRKKQIQRDIDTLKEKIASKQYTEIPTTPYDIKKDAALAELARIKNVETGKLRRLTQVANEKNATTMDKLLDARRNLMVSGLHTAAKVGEASLVKTILDPAMEASIGRLGSWVTGSPATTGRAAMEGIKSLGKFKDAKAAEKGIADMRDAKISSLVSLQRAVDGGDKKEIAKAQKEFKKADLRYAIASIYHSINANSIKDIKDYMAHGATDYDQANGLGIKRYISEKNTRIGKLGYLAGSIIRSHPAMKSSVAARSELVRSYTSTLERFQKEGKPLDEGNMALALAMANNDYQYGQFKNKTEFSQWINKTKESKSKAARFVTKFLFPIATTPLNILKTGIDMSTFGAEGWIRLATEAKKNMKLNAEEGEQYDKWTDRVKEGIKKMTPAEKKYIARVVGNGTVGAVVGILAAIGASTGAVRYGGSFDEHRKELGSDGQPLDPDAWEFFGWRAPKFLNALINHTPHFLPAALATNWVEIKKADARRLAEGKDPDKVNPTKETMNAGINELLNRFPTQTLADLFSSKDKVGSLTESVVSNPLGKEANQFLDKKDRENKTLGEKLKSNVGLGFLNPEANPEKTFSIKKGNTQRQATDEEVATFTKEKGDLLLKKMSDAKVRPVMLDRFGNVTLDKSKKRRTRTYESLSQDDKNKLAEEYSAQATRETKKKLFGKEN